MRQMEAEFEETKKKMLADLEEARKQAADARKPEKEAKEQTMKDGARGDERAGGDTKKKARKKATVQAGQYLQSKDVTLKNLRVLDRI